MTSQRSLERELESLLKDFRRKERLNQFRNRLLEDLERELREVTDTQFDDENKQYLVSQETMEQVTEALENINHNIEDIKTLERIEELLEELQDHSRSRWYPTRAQWVVIWACSILALGVWIANAHDGNQHDRVAAGIVVVGALVVWELSGKKGRA